MEGQNCRLCCRVCHEKSELSGELGIADSVVMRWMGVSAGRNMPGLKCTYNVILRRVRLTVIAGLSVSNSISLSALKAHTQYCIVHIPYFYTLSHKRHDYFGEGREVIA